MTSPSSKTDRLTPAQLDEALGVRPRPGHRLHPLAVYWNAYLGQPPPLQLAGLAEVARLRGERRP